MSNMKQVKNVCDGQAVSQSLHTGLDKHTRQQFTACHKDTFIINHSTTDRLNPPRMINTYVLTFSIHVTYQYINLYNNH